MTIPISLTPADIDGGVRGACGSCPIAIAAARAGLVEPDIGMYAGAGYVLHRMAHGLRYTKLPAIATAFIEAFDLGKPVSPISFNVDIS